ncbi:MAG TPA: GatB/YqeY domain-containing protein [Microlunatus sp.]|nr:GatB/YqeY domain-containing protein [Microlunatus sp.]
MTDLRSRLQDALRTALKDRDRAAAAAVRSALAAIGNAEAVDPTPQPPAVGSAEIAGAVIGVGGSELARRELADDDLVAIVAGEVADRRSAAADYQRAGRADRAEQLRHEADLLDRILHAD